MMIDESQGAPDFVTVSIPTSTTTARQFQNGAKTYLVFTLKRGAGNLRLWQYFKCKPVLPIPLYFTP